MKRERLLRCCRTNHASEAGVIFSRPGIVPRGTIIAGWSVYSHFRTCAIQFGLTFEQLKHLTDLAAEYETKYDEIAVRIGTLRKLFSDDEMTMDAAKSLIREVNDLTVEADFLFLEYAYKGREIIPDEVWDRYEAWLDKIGREQRITYR
ncbi:hypothetical protein EH221_04510 [bacterium]|nr:MAG: hypothetical protein EH221_04510 [bacterium]